MNPTKSACSPFVVQGPPREKGRKSNKPKREKSGLSWCVHFKEPGKKSAISVSVMEKCFDRAKKRGNQKQVNQQKKH